MTSLSLSLSFSLYSLVATGLITPMEGERCRKAAEVAISDAYHPGYKIPYESRGDIFYPAIITNHGSWYYQSSDFLRAVTHSGDKVDCTDLEAERFDHYSRTWASWKHSTFLMQAVACNMAQATYTAFETAAGKHWQLSLAASRLRHSIIGTIAEYRRRRPALTGRNKPGQDNTVPYAAEFRTITDQP